MNCMKCGRETMGDTVFCDVCRKDMEKYPVKPGIAIQLPNRKETPPVRKAHPKRRQPPTSEEQILRLRKRLTRVIILWLITLGLLAATIYPTVEYFVGKTILQPGQNYTTITSTEPK